MAESRVLVLCADDFGLAADIDAGILALAAQGRLTAAGCMAAGPSFAADAGRLVGLADRIDIGLHFALTELPPLGPVASLGGDGGPHTLGQVLVRSLTGRIDYREIAAEIGRQVDRFREITGRDPDFVDGHQHVHVFPGVRAGLLAAFDAGVLDARRTWVRTCADRPAAIVSRGIEVPKALFISALSSGFSAQARARGITVNDGFRGITAFEPAAFPGLMAKFVTGPGRAPLAMCHPASPDLPAPASDPIAAARRAEYAHLASDAFAADLAAAGVRLVRMREVAAG